MNLKPNLSRLLGTFQVNNYILLIFDISRFQVMQPILSYHRDCADLYYSLFAILLGTPIGQLPIDAKFDDNVLNDIFEVKRKSLNVVVEC